MSKHYTKKVPHSVEAELRHMAAIKSRHAGIALRDSCFLPCSPSDMQSDGHCRKECILRPENAVPVCPINERSDGYCRADVSGLGLPVDSPRLCSVNCGLANNPPYDFIQVKLPF